MRQRGFGYVEILIVIAVIAALGAVIWGIYNEGKGAGRAEVKLDWDKANREQRDREEKQIKTAAKALEDERAKKKIVYRTITQAVDRIVDRPVYRNVCMDADGLRCVNAALLGEDATGCKPTDGVPAASPARVDGRGSGDAEADRSR